MYEEKKHSADCTLLVFMISNTFLNQLLPNIQQTKMLVMCQRFGDLFLFGLVWQYSEKHSKGRFKVMDTYLQLSYNFEPTFLH